MLAAFVGDAGIGAQGPDAVAAVLGQPHHALLVDGIALGAAVHQHLPHPLELEQRTVRLDGERGVLLEHPLDGFERHAGRGPGRCIARGDLAGIGKTGPKRGRGLTVDHGDFMAGTGQVPGAGNANYATAKNENAHSRKLATKK